MRSSNSLRFRPWYSLSSSKSSTRCLVLGMSAPVALEPNKLVFFWICSDDLYTNEYQLRARFARLWSTRTNGLIGNKTPIEISWVRTWIAAGARFFTLSAYEQRRVFSFRITHLGARPSCMMIWSVDLTGVHCQEWCCFWNTIIANKGPNIELVTLVREDSWYREESICCRRCYRTLSWLIAPIEDL